MKSALFSEDWFGFGIARMYEGLMQGTPIKCRAHFATARPQPSGWVCPGDFETRRQAGASPLRVNLKQPTRARAVMRAQIE